MAPFAPPTQLLSGLKDRPEALTAHGERLYVGTASGAVLVYSFDEDGTAELLETKKGLGKRGVEQLGYVRDAHALAVLADSVLTLYPLPALGPPAPLTRAKTVFSFATHASTDADGARLTRLVVGAQRKVLVYSWKDGDAQEPTEAALPHSARTIAFVADDAVSLSYDLTTHVLFSLSTLSVTELSVPPPASASAISAAGVGMGYLGMGKGLGGYMTLGLGAKGRPCAARTGEKDVLLGKDNEGTFFGPDGKPSRPERIEWPAPPSEIAFVEPYIFAALPPGTVPTTTITDASASPDAGTSAAAAAPSFIPTPVLQLHSALSLPAPVQTITLPIPAPHALRLLAPAPGALYAVSTPTNAATATAEGSAVWRVQMTPWAAQVDELVAHARYDDARALLAGLSTDALPDAPARTTLVRTLAALARFERGEHDAALAEFMELDVNPAKVVALFPEHIAGRLSVPRAEWVPLFGGPRPAAAADAEASGSGSEKGEDEKEREDEREKAGSPLPRAAGGLMGRFKSPFDAIRPAAPRDADTASIASAGTARRAPGAPADDSARALESLIKYLPDRRAKLARALEAFGVSAASAHTQPALLSIPVAELLAQPDAPPRALAPEQLVRAAQVVDTALFKTILAVRPGLLGSFCRRDNWCEVAEMEGMLRERRRFAELIDLWRGKEMHDAALALLQKLSEEEDDAEDKLRPSIAYLQRLGPAHAAQIFAHARWVLSVSADLGLQVFTADEAPLPPARVADFLEQADPRLCARFLEHLVGARGERAAEPEFHDRLAALYLGMAVRARAAGAEEERKEAYAKLLAFISTTTHYRIEKLFGLLPADDFYEAKAVLLGRLGRHAAALELYVYRLHDYAAAEAYCLRVHAPGSDTADIFLSLLRIYLAPAAAAPGGALLPPALALIACHAPRLDTAAALALLPPLVPAADVAGFLARALRAPAAPDARVVKGVGKARAEQVARRLMRCEANRVRVASTRICPQCHKRIGPSVIAVHAPAGEVTHYNCREPFALKLKEMRRA